MVRKKTYELPKIRKEYAAFDAQKVFVKEKARLDRIAKEKEAEDKAKPKKKKEDPAKP